jgi:hypothetical protein
VADRIHWAIVVLVVAIGLVTDPVLRSLGRLRYRAAWWWRIAGLHLNDWMKARTRRH